MARVPTRWFRRLANSTMTGNGSGSALTGGGTIDSYGENYIDGNAGGETVPTKISPE